MKAFELRTWRTDTEDANAFEFCQFFDTPMEALVEAGRLSQDAAGFQYVRAECWLADVRQWQLKID